MLNKNTYFIKRLFLVLFFGVFSLNSSAQLIRLTPELIQEFITYIEKNAFPITTYLSNSKDLSVFVKTLKFTDEFKTLDSGEEFTVFAPTNEAFEQFPTEVLTQLFQEVNKEKLRSIVTYHIVKGKLRASGIAHEIDKNAGRETQIRTLNGLDITAYYDEDTLFIKDDNGYSIKVLQQDILLSNGLVYKIDTVILPQVDNEKGRF